MPPMSPEGQVALGIIVGLLSTCVQSLGLTMQRKSHILEDEKDEDVVRRPPYRRRRWQVGMLLFLIANIVGSSIQITTLPLPVLSTLQASGLVFNSILASLILKEAWTWRTVYGTVLVAAGAVLVSFFSAVPEPSHSLHQLLELLFVPAFLVWFILSLVFVLMILILTFTLRFCVPGLRGDSPRVCLVNGMSFGMVSGILSAHALLLAKSAVELIVTSLTERQNQFKSFEPWLLLLAFLFLALAQLYYLHLGLKLISTSILYPFVFCVYNIVAILDGLIYFRQMSRLRPLSAGLIALGTVLLLSGVLALSWRLQDDEEDTGDQPTMTQADIPQTVLAPGMGFVGDPELSPSDCDSIQSEDDLESEREITEHTNLLRKSLSRSRSTTNKIPGFVPGHSHVHHNRRRRRAATLKEVRDIWDSLGDDESYYGTFHRPTSSGSGPDQPPSSPHRLRQKRRRRSSLGKALEPQDLDEPGSVFAPRRSVTLPPRVSESTQQKRRRSRHFEQNALFSSLLNPDWWRSKRKDDDDNDEEAVLAPREDHHASGS